MIYTAKDREELMEQINKGIIEIVDTFLSKLNEKRKADGDKMLVKTHILTHKDHSERTTLVVTSEKYDCMYIYYPLSGSEKPIQLVYDSPDDILFEYLEKGYEIAEMELCTHAAIWSCISEINMVDCKDGLQKYLEYCMQNGITIDKLNSEYNYQFFDLLSFYADDVKEDIFLRTDAFKNEAWYGDVILFARIGVCKPKVEHAPEVCKALKQLGYSVRLKTKDGELYILPVKDKKPKETEAR